MVLQCYTFFLLLLLNGWVPILLRSLKDSYASKTGDLSVLNLVIFSMRLKVDQDGERVVMDSWDLRILSAAIASFVVLVIMILCDLSHPVASLECVRHETTKFANVNITKSSSSVGPFTSLDSSATTTAGPHQAGEDNDCELLVRRQLGGAASEERGYESGTDLRMGHQHPHEDSSLRAARSFATSRGNMPSSRSHPHKSRFRSVQPVPTITPIQ